MSATESTARLVLVTAPDEGVGRTLARGLVQARLAACVNVLPGMTSVYRWEGAVQEESEVLLVVKTRRENSAQLERWVLEQHPYDVPELVWVEPERVEPSYLGWLLAEADTDGAP